MPIGEVGLLLGLSDLAHDALQKGVGLVLHLCLVYIVIRNRRQVRHWLRAPAGATGLIASVRNRFARVWHWVALFFLVAGWLVWAVEVPHGYRRGAALFHHHRAGADRRPACPAAAAGRGGSGHAACAEQSGAVSRDARQAADLSPDRHRRACG